MALSRITYPYSGQETFAINFPLGFLKRSDVTLRVNNEVDSTGSATYRTIVWLSDGVIQAPTGLTVGDSITIERTASKTQLENDYQDGSQIIEENLDDSFKQALMVAQEALDGRLSSFAQDLDLGGNSATNLAPAVEDTDAPTFAQLKEYTGDAPGFALAAEQSADDANEDRLRAELAAANAADDRITSTAAAVIATGAAASLSFPIIQVGDEGKVPTIKADRSGYEFVFPKTSFIGLSVVSGSLVMETGDEGYVAEDYFFHDLAVSPPTYSINSNGHLVATSI